MNDRFEFWSSVEYSAFLKGLVRELCGATTEGRRQVAEAGGRRSDDGDRTTADRGLKTEHDASASGDPPRSLGCGTDTRSDPTGISACQRFAVTESEYRQARGTLARLRMRWRCYVGYPVQLRRRVRKEAAPQALVVCTNTFYAPWIAMRSARKRGIPVVHWMFDLFPDVLVLAGKLKPGSPGERWLRRWVRSMFDGAAANVFLGDKLLAFAESKFGPIPRCVVIPVGCDAAPFAEREPRSRAAGEPVRLLYCGNFGRMHDVDTIAGALAGGVPKGVQVSFRGNGAGFTELASKLGGGGMIPGLSLGGSLPEGEWLHAMAQADVALVTMKPGAEGIVMPSKTYSAMAAGQAILAVCPRQADLADTVLRHDCGWVVTPGDVAGLRAVMESLPARSEEVLAKRRNAWRAARECYDQTVLAARWRELLGGLTVPDDK